MRSYIYTARDAGGSSSRGTIRAESREEAYQKLSDNGLYNLQIEEEDESAVGRKKMRLLDLVFFCRQMSTMLASGLTVLKSIDILYNRAEQPHLKTIYLGLYESLQKGFSLTDAFMEQKGVFPPLLVSLVRAGEMSGSLDSVMIKLSDHYEKENRIRKRIVTGMTYPIILLIVTLIVIIALFTFVLPRFFVMFANTELPALTKALMSISDFLVSRWYLLLLAALLAALFIALLSQIPRVRLFLDRLKLSYPIAGKLMKTIYAARFTHALSILYSSGIAMIDSVQNAVEVLGNYYIEQRFRDVTQRIEQGEMLSSSLESTGLFDSILTSIVFVGEESGSLDTVLSKLSEFYDEESEAAMQKLVTLIEPVMIIIIAIVITTVIIGVLVPIYNMYGSIL